MLVVADTSPLNYLVLIEHIEVLPRLFSRVLIPSPVLDELLHSGSPSEVRAWAANLPAWITVCRPTATDIVLDSRLGAGERAAITLCLQSGVELMLVDELLGRAEAQRHHLSVIGVLGILKRAHMNGLLDLNTSLDLLQQTSFWAHPSIFEALRVSVRK